MSRELTSFFAELSANPLLMEKFEADPSAMLAETGISEAEKQLVLTRDLTTISERLISNGRTSTKKKKTTKKKK